MSAKKKILLDSDIEKKLSKNLLRAGIITDAHIPYEHKKRYSAMMNCFADSGLDGLYIIGDFADIYGLQMHGPRNPGVIEKFQDEVNAVNARLDEIDKTFPNAKKVYIEGNHETRFERYLHQYAAPLFGLVEIQTLFKMHERPGWTWVPYGPRQLTTVLDSKLHIKHEPTTASITQMAKEHGDNLTFGHIHRILEVYHRSISGKQHVSFCSGWMGDFRYDKIFGYVKGHNKWQNGFTMVEVEAQSKLFHHQTVALLDNDSCAYNGKLYRP